MPTFAPGARNTPPRRYELEPTKQSAEMMAGALTVTFGSRRDRYLGMTAAIPQVSVPTAII